MPKFRKRPVVIEAFQVGGAAQSEWPSWLNEAWEKPIGDPGSYYSSGDGLWIQTLEGVHRVSPGDWIVQGIKGELYPVKPDIFAATYEPAE
jgi:hypothetical protein